MKPGRRGGLRAVVPFLLVAVLTFATAIGPVPSAIAYVMAAVRVTETARGPVIGAHLSSPLGGVGAKRPNIVFVLTDDLSKDLIRFMPHVQALAQAGMRFTNYTVDDSLCCPSRASIFTGRYPHNTGIFTNNSVDGGFALFHSRGEERQTFATSLQQAGYRTALLGKYLNGYSALTHFDGPRTWVPPGWDRWGVAGWGYPEFDYYLNLDHEVRTYGHAPQDYLTTVLQHFGQDFITSSAREQRPFLLELATFSPHKPYTPAPEDRDSFAGVRAPRGPSFNRHPTNQPPWLSKVQPLNAPRITSIDRAYRERVQAVQSVDRTIDALQRSLAAAGQLANTVFVFSSDNGYHLGQHGLSEGKLTAFDTDINVPLIISGPGIAPATVNRDLVQNIDLAPTFDDIAGARVPAIVDGRSIVPLLTRAATTAWRRAALIEHHGLDVAPNDPDRQSQSAGNPPTYRAIRTAAFTYVHYYNGEREYYDRVHDPNELHNIYNRLTPARIAALNRWVAALRTCHGASQCTAARRG